MFNHIYQGRRVLITGDSGFKGSWLCVWLKKLGAELCGVSLPLETTPAHNDLLKIDMRSENCDIRNYEKLLAIVESFQPEIVFHLAAQPIVRLSYAEPVLTFDSNVMGTVHVLEACRRISSVKAIVAISSDKCYENREQIRGYRENDAMGGYDPYSASKGCTELVISSYRHSFFNPADYRKKHETLLASGRAGNVIGGGDWAQDRLVPDIMRAAASGVPAQLRNPLATRPWQHVLEPLSGYLLLGEKLYRGETEFADGWNFGPNDDGIISVGTAAHALSDHWDAIKLETQRLTEQPHEANLLRLDCSKARYRLGWHGVMTPDETFKMTAEWYRQFYTLGEIITFKQLDEYIEKAQKKELKWTRS